MLEATGHERPDAFYRTLPAWDETPGYINMPFVLWLYNLARGWDMQEYASWRYKMLGHDLPWIPGNNAAGVDKSALSEVLQETTQDTEEIISLLESAHACLLNP